MSEETGSVLVLARELPHPPNAGDRIVTSGFVRALACRGRDVYLLAFGREGDEEAAADLGRVCDSVRRAPSTDPSLPTTLLKAGRYARGRSHVMAMFDSGSFRDAAAEQVRAVSPDVVLAEHPYMGQCFLDGPVSRAIDEVGARPVVDAHVVEYAAHERLRRHADDRDLATRAELAFEIPRLRRTELDVYDAAERTLVLGEEDREELSGRVSGPVRRQRVALDVDGYETADPADAEPGRLIFFGSYDWFPNGDAARWLCEAILPGLRERQPGFELVLAGRGAPASVRALDSEPNVRFVGEVDDLASLVRTAAAVVAPLRVGGGVRIKVLESMAWGVPVVTTPSGFEGVEATPGEDLLVADGRDAFVDAAASLLDDPERRRRIARNARRTVEARYAIERVAPELESNLGLEATERIEEPVEPSPSRGGP